MSPAIDALLAGLRARTWHGGATLRLHEESCEAILSVVERARVVGVIDAKAGAAEVSVRGHQVTFPGPVTYILRIGGMFVGEGATPDEARAAAARAIEAGEV